MTTLRLLVFTSTFPRWPNDTDPPFVYELSKRLTSDFEVSILAPHYPGSSKKEYMDGMTVYRFRYFFAPFEKLAGGNGIIPTLRSSPFYYLVVPCFLIAQLLALISISRKIKPDVVHAHWIIPQGIAAFLAEKVTGVPFVVTAHGTDVFSLRGKIFLWFKRVVLSNAKAVTVVSKSLLKTISSGVPDTSRVKVLSMGVSEKRFAPAWKDASLREKYTIRGPFLLYVGRLSEQKGVRYLIEAMGKVVAVFPTAKLLILGDGDFAPVLQQQVEDLRLGERIVFLGAVANREIPVYYATADVFVGPSIQAVVGDTEGFGLTFVEAAMSGCFVVGTNVGGIGDIIRDKETGLLVPQKDSNALADAILFGLQNKKETKKMVYNARKRCVEKFEWKVIAKQYIDFLKCDTGIREP